MYLLILLFLCMTVAALCQGMHNRKKEIRLLREEIARRDRMIRLPDTITKEMWERALDEMSNPEERWGGVMVIGRTEGA